MAFQSKRQTACSRSTTEAEAIALATALFSDVQSLRKSSYLIKHPNSRQIVRATDAKEPFVTPQLGIRKTILNCGAVDPKTWIPPRIPSHSGLLGKTAADAKKRFVTPQLDICELIGEVGKANYCIFWGRRGGFLKFHCHRCKKYLTFI